MTFKMAVAAKGIDSARRELANIQKQIDFATANTINTMAFDSKKQLDEQIKTRLDRPTRFTQRAIEVVKARRNTLVGVVGVSARQGRSETLKHLFVGGVRSGKGYEGVLKQIGALPGGMYTVPGKAAPLNTFGNIRKAFIDKTIKELRSKPTPKNTKSTLPPGIWLRTTVRSRRKKGERTRRGGKTKELFVVHKQVKAAGKSRKASGPAPEAVMLFIEKPKYRRVFDIAAVVNQTIQIGFNKEFDKNLKRALATAKRT